MRDDIRVRKYYIQGRIPRKAWWQPALLVSLIGLAIALVVVFHHEPKAALAPKKPISVVRTQAKQPAVIFKSAAPPPAPVKLTKPFGLATGETLPWNNPARLNAELSDMTSLGVSWIRVDVSWASIQPDNPSQYDWSPLDHIVAAANSHGLKILGTLGYTPAWAGLPACTPSQRCAPASPGQFATFAAAAASRYASLGVHSWEIWNEPNLEGFWQPAPSPSDYTQLLQASYPAIKRVDPNALVLTGGLGPLDGSSLSLPQQTFLRTMYLSGAKAYFDAVGYHPYAYPATPSHVASWSGWSTMADVSDSIRAIMTAYGDAAKPVWATEFGAPTNGPGALATSANFNYDAHPDHVDEALQAAMLTDAVTQYKTDPWLGGFFWYNYQDLGASAGDTNNFFGLLRYDGSSKPAYAAYRTAISGN